MADPQGITASVGRGAAMQLRAAHLGELAAVLERVRLIKGIGATETSIHLQSYRG